MATRYYVATTGNDGNDGLSSGTPKGTINQALAIISAGDIIEVATGTYTDIITSAELTSGIDNDNRTIIEAASGATVWIKPTADNSSVLFLSNKNYITIDGINVDGVDMLHTNPLQTPSLIQFNQGSHDCSFLNLTIKNNSNGNGISDSGKASYNMIIDNCDISNNGAVGSNLHHGVYIQFRDCIVRNSRIYDNKGHGIHFFNQSTDDAHRCEAYNNTVYGNGSTGILMGSGNDQKCYNNIVYRNGAALNANGIRVAFRTPLRTKVYNNTVFANESHGIRIDGTQIAYFTEVKNNISEGNGGTDIYTVGSSGTVLSNNHTTGALFTNTTEGSEDFRLQSTSTARGYGLDLSAEFTTDNIGTTRVAWDAGALEFVVQAPIANDDSVETDKNTAVAIDVLANDNPDGQTIDATTVNEVQPINGSVVVHPTTGVCTYTPNLDFLGVDTFTYTVDDTDGDTSNVATVSITVVEPPVEERRDIQNLRRRRKREMY